MKQKIFSILRWSERYTKTDMVYLFSGSLWLNISKSFIIILNLLLVVFFANLVPEHTYGQYKYLLSFFVLLSIPALNGIGPSLLLSVSKGYENSVHSAVKAKLIWGLGGSLISTVISLYYLFSGDINLFWGFILMAIFIPFMNGYRLWSEYLNGRHQYRALGFYLTLFEFVKVLTLILVIIFSSRNLFSIIFAYLFIDSLVKFIIYKIVLKKFPPNKKVDIDMVSYGKKISLLKIIRTISNQADKILLFYLLGPIQLAIYSFAIRPVNEIRKFVGSIVDISTPKITVNDFATLKKTMPRKILGFILLLLPLVFILIFLLPYLYKFIFPRYVSSIIYAQIFTLVILLFPKDILEQIFISHSKTTELNYTNQFVSILKILLFLIMLPLFGIWGAIITILISEFINFTILFYLFIK
jgi:O-antigen/teichoic acid export membrane protein